MSNHTPTRTAWKKGKEPGPGRPRLPEEVKKYRALTQTELAEIHHRFARMEASELLEYYTKKKGTALECYVASLFAHAMKDGDPTRGEAALYPLVGKVRPSNPGIAVQINNTVPSYDDVFAKTLQITSSQIQRLEEISKTRELDREELQSLQMLQKSLIEAKAANDENNRKIKENVSKMSTEELKARFRQLTEVTNEKNDPNGGS